MAGETIWRCGINTDKAKPMGLRFSTSGDAVVCFDDFDGGKRIRFYNIAKKYGWTYSKSPRSIGFDQELRRFLVFDGGVIIFDVGSLLGADSVKSIPPDTIVLYDRRCSIRAQYSEDSWPLSTWKGAAIDRENEQVVMASANALYWISLRMQPRITRRKVCSFGNQELFDFSVSSVPNSDILFVRAREYASGSITAVLLTPSKGELWRASDLKALWFIGQQLVVHRSSDNRIEVIDIRGSIVTEAMMDTHGLCLAMNVFDGGLWVAECVDSLQDLKVRCILNLK
jgi:hypothetical protein